jgi:hypothetical protein
MKLAGKRTAWFILKTQKPKWENKMAGRTLHEGVGLRLL